MTRRHRIALALHCARAHAHEAASWRRHRATLVEEAALEDYAPALDWRTDRGAEPLEITYCLACSYMVCRCGRASALVS